MLCFSVMQPTSGTNQTQTLNEPFIKNRVRSSFYHLVSKYLLYKSTHHNIKVHTMEKQLLYIMRSDSVACRQDKASCNLKKKQTTNKKQTTWLIHSFSKNAGLTKEKARGFVAVKEIKLLWHILLKAVPGSLGFLIEGALPMNTKGCLILNRLVMKSSKATNKQTNKKAEFWSWFVETTCVHVTLVCCHVDGVNMNRMPWITRRWRRKPPPQGWEGH